MKTSDFHPLRLRVVLHAVFPALTVFGLVSCNSVNKPDSGYTEYSGRPANYPVDGRYNPYKPGEAKPARGTTQYQEFSDGSSKPSGNESQPKKKKTSTSDSTASSTAKKKTTTTSDSSSTASAKPKPKSTGGQTITIKHEDTFYGLAKKYHTTVAALKKANNRTSDVLRDGEKIKIP